MKREELISLIDKVTSGKGILRTTGYWMRKLFKEVLGYTDDAVKNVKVEVDSEMSDSSENAVSNKVIKAYVDGMASWIEEDTTSSYLTLQNGHKYNVTTATFGLTLSAKEENADGKYLIEFTTGMPTFTPPSTYSGRPFSMTLPAGVKWANGKEPLWELDAKYIVRIENRIATAHTDVMTLDEVKELDFETPYLTFIAMRDGMTITRNYIAGDLEYSIDNGDWEVLKPDSTTPEINAGHHISFRGSAYTGKVFNLRANKSSYVTGKCSSLFPSSGASGMELLFAFGHIRGVNRNIISDVGNPRTAYMFRGCVELVNGVDFPSVDLLWEGQCRMMYSGCLSLIYAPTLPATKVGKYCYSGTLAYCISLKTPPALPATTLAEGCYGYKDDSQSAFENGFNQGMFKGSGIEVAPALPATTLAAKCYKGMYEGCKNIKQASYLPASTLAAECYAGMYYGCSNLQKIKMLATDISATDCLANWVSGVASSGTFIKAAGVTIPTGESGIPSGWTIEEVAV